MILVTGVSGFIGKHVLDALVEEYGAQQIVALTSKPIDTCPYLLHHDYTFGKDYFIRSGFGAIDTILHLGAFTPKSVKESDNWEYVNSNIFNTHHLLTADLPSLKKIIYASTLDVYGRDTIISEQSPVSPASLYGESKLYCEKMIGSWSNAADKKCQILRIGHVYGPGEELYKKIIPVTIRKLLADEPVQIWGTGRDIRSFIYIGDVVTAILQSLKLNENVGVINVVSSQQITILDLVQSLIDISGKTVEIELVPSTVAGRDFVFNNAKMKEFLLRSETLLLDGLKEEWRYMKLINT